jgi:hypothetical protein
VAECRNCDARLERGARFCPQCGEPTDAGDTRALEVPPDETGPVPVTIDRSEPRFYGVTPAAAALFLAAATLALAIVLFALGRWPFGLIALGAAVLLAVAFFDAARRKQSGMARSTVEALDSAGARAGVAAGSLVTRGRATSRVFALRQDLRRLASQRPRLLFELGEAVYRGDAQATEEARSRVEELDRRAAEREAEIQHVVEATRHVLSRRRLEVQPTEVAEQPEEPPTPAPGEGNPPEPARIPEPYPPPDEGSPPQPTIIPEPGPAVIPEPGPQGRKQKGRT